MAEHTKGPWKVHYAEKRGGNIVAPSGPVASTRWFGNTHEQVMEDYANARLIAAAPDLLEACQAAEKLIDDMARFVGQMSLRDYAAFNDVPIKLRRAIARTSTDGGRDG
jgi:hypothetical protein